MRRDRLFQDHQRFLAGHHGHGHARVDRQTTPVEGVAAREAVAARVARDTTLGEGELRRRLAWLDEDETGLGIGIRTGSSVGSIGEDPPRRRVDGGHGSLGAVRGRLVGRKGWNDHADQAEKGQGSKG